MTVAELKEELAKYPDDMEVNVSEDNTAVEGEIMLDPYFDYNLLVITYKEIKEDRPRSREF